MKNLKKLAALLLLMTPLMVVYAGEHAGDAADKKEHAGEHKEHAGDAAEHKKEHAGDAAEHKEHAGEPAEEE